MPDERFAHGCDSRADRVADIEVSCFCEARDLLSQWRGYGPYRGFAIGFSKRALAEIDSIERAPVLLDDLAETAPQDRDFLNAWWAFRASRSPLS